MSGKEVTSSRLADIGQKLKAMRKLLVDLSCVKVTEDKQRSPASRPSTSRPVRRRARCQLSPDKEGELAKEVMQRVDKSISSSPSSQMQLQMMTPHQGRTSPRHLIADDP